MILNFLLIAANYPLIIYISSLIALHSYNFAYNYNYYSALLFESEFSYLFEMKFYWICEVTLIFSGGGYFFDFLSEIICSASAMMHSWLDFQSAKTSFSALDLIYDLKIVLLR